MKRFFSYAPPEKIARDKTLLLKKPAKNQARKQTNNENRPSVFCLHITRVDNLRMLACPKVPVCNLSIETFVQGISIETFLPCLVQSYKVVKVKFIVKDWQGEIVQDLDVGAENMPEIGSRALNSGTFPGHSFNP